MSMHMPFVIAHCTESSYGRLITAIQSCVRVQELHNASPVAICERIAIIHCGNPQVLDHNLAGITLVWRLQMKQ